MRFISAPEQNTFQEIRSYKNKLGKQILIKLSKVFNDIQRHIFSLLKNSSTFYILMTLKNVSSYYFILGVQLDLPDKDYEPKLRHILHSIRFTEGISSFPALDTWFWAPAPGHSTPAAFLSPASHPPQYFDHALNTHKQLPRESPAPTQCSPANTQVPPQTPPVIRSIGVIFQTKEL